LRAHPLRDTLPVLVGQFVNQLRILEQQWFAAAAEPESWLSAIRLPPVVVIIFCILTPILLYEINMLFPLYKNNPRGKNEHDLTYEYLLYRNYSYLAIKM
jgi:hypothetical protein